MSPQTEQSKLQIERQETPKRKITPKQIAALVCVVLLVGMYIGAFVVACLDPGDSGRLFAGCLVATIGLPILLWLLIWSFGLLKKRREEILPPKNQDTPDNSRSGILP